jgi:ABC-type spermidine/putrescine transport system permease subunit II
MGNRLVFSSAITLATLIFLLGPLLIVVLFSFNDAASLSFPLMGLSTRWYHEVFQNADFVEALVRSLELATLTAAVTLVLGTAAAYGVTRSNSRLRNPASAILVLPVTLPSLFLGIALLSAIVRVQLAPSFFTIAVAHVIVAFPFFFLIAKIALERLDPLLEQAAADLGASPIQAFMKVTLPQIAPILLGASALSFMVSLDEFVVTVFVSGSNLTLPTFLYSRLRQAIDPSINVVSSILMFVTLVLGAAAYLLNARRIRRAANGVNEVHT